MVHTVHAYIHNTNHILTQALSKCVCMYVCIEFCGARRCGRILPAEEGRGRRAGRKVEQHLSTIRAETP